MKSDIVRGITRLSIVTGLVIASSAMISLPAPAMAGMQEAVGQQSGEESAGATISKEALEVLTRYEKEIGGTDKITAIKTMSSVGKMAIPEANVSGELSIVQTADGNAKVSMSIPGVIDQESGVINGVAYETSSLTGPSLLEGERKFQTGLMSRIGGTDELRKMFDSIELTGTEEFRDEECNVLKLTKKDFGPIEFLYSVESGLQVGMRMTASTEMGDMDIEASISDYREVDGIKFPFKTVSYLPNGMSQEMNMEKIEINVKLSDDAFKLPADVQKLVDKQSKGK